MRVPHTVCGPCTFGTQTRMREPHTVCGLPHTICGVLFFLPHTVCGNLANTASWMEKYRQNRIPYAGIWQIPHPGWRSPHPGFRRAAYCMRFWPTCRIQYAVPCTFVTQLARIQYAVPASCMRDRIRYAVILKITKWAVSSAYTSGSSQHKQWTWRPAENSYLENGSLFTSYSVSTKSYL